MPSDRDKNSDRIEIEFQGRRLTGRIGDTLAEVLLSHGVLTLRTNRAGEPRGVFCGMGLCQECRVVVDGVPNHRACQTPAVDGCRVDMQDDRVLGWQE